MAKGKGAETTLGIIGSVLDLAGPLIFGPDARGIDFGAPFKAGAQAFASKREQDNLIELLGSSPETAPLIELGSQAAQAGGLLNVLGGTTEDQIAPQPTNVAAGILPGEAGGLPNSELLQVLGGATAPEPGPSALATSPTPSVDAGIDITSPDFLRRAAELRPDIAEKLLLSGARGPSEIDELKKLMSLQLLGNKIENFETPAQKRDARAKIRADERRQRLADQASKITTSEEKVFREGEELLARYNNLFIDVEKGNASSLGLGTLSRFGGAAGDRIVQALNVDKAAAFKNIKESNALYQKFISGVAVSEPEARRLASTQVQATDSPETQLKVVRDQRKKAREAILIARANAFDRMAQSGGSYNLPDRGEIQLYQQLRLLFNKDFERALKSPKVQAIRAQLGIDYGTSPKPKSKRRK